MADWLSHLDSVDAGKEAEEPSPDSSAEEYMRHGYPAGLEEAEGLAHAVTSNTWQLGSFLSYSPLRQHAISALLLCQTDIWLMCYRALSANLQVGLLSWRAHPAAAVACSATS